MSGAEMSAAASKDADPALVAVVTGGAAGAGLAIAQAIHARGARVLIVDVDGDAARAAAHDLERGAALQVDLTADGAATEVMRSCVERFGRVDALVNNAAIYPSTPFGTVSPSDLERVFRLNVFAPTLLMQAFAEVVIHTGGTGAIVNVLSQAAFRPTVNGMHVYGASKAALWAMTREMALELAPHGIRVNAVAPGPIDSGEDRGNRVGYTAEEYQTALQKVVDQIPMKRRILASEVGDAVGYLLSPGAAAITGVCVPVDGGASI